MSETKGVAAVDRALSILDAFDQQPTPITISEIARRTGLYKSTALRLVHSLKSAGYIRQEDDGRYHLGPALLRLGSTYQRANRMEERILPILRALVARGSESPSFYIRHDAKRRLCLFRVDSGHSTLDRIKTGVLLPLDRGAAGRVFLAYGDAPDASGAEIRRNGYAVSYGETDPDCAAVAAPILDYNAEIAGVLSISGPLNRFTPQVVEQQVQYLLPAAAELTAAFGGRPRESADLPRRAVALSG